MLLFFAEFSNLMLESNPYYFLPHHNFMTHTKIFGKNYLIIVGFEFIFLGHHLLHCTSLQLVELK